jgi:hypothetical protein
LNGTEPSEPFDSPGPLGSKGPIDPIGPPEPPPPPHRAGIAGAIPWLLRSPAERRPRFFFLRLVGFALLVALAFKLVATLGPGMGDIAEIEPGHDEVSIRLSTVIRRQGLAATIVAALANAPLKSRSAMITIIQ